MSINSYPELVEQMFNQGRAPKFGKKKVNMQASRRRLYGDNQADRNRIAKAEADCARGDCDELRRIMKTGGVRRAPHGQGRMGPDIWEDKRRLAEGGAVAGGVRRRMDRDRRRGGG